VTDPANPNHISNYFKAGSVHVLDVFVSGSYAYVAMGGLGLRIVDISDPANPQEVGFSDTEGVAEAVQVSGSYAYLADGGDGLRIFDISDPANPHEIGFYDTPAPGYTKDVYLSDRYAFIGDGPSSLLLVIDVSDPANPELVGEYETPGFVWGIYITDAHAYVANGEHGMLILQRLSPSQLSCSVSTESVSIGDSITVSGAISPAQSGVPVTLSYMINGSWSTLATITSASDGGFSHIWMPTSVGSYQLKASWTGDSSFVGATSSEVSVIVTKVSTTLSCSVSSSEVTEGEPVTISGAISPEASDKRITLTYQKPDGSTVTRTITTGSDGTFSDSYTPNVDGSWSVSASWDGDSTHEGASSSSKSFTVKKKSGCLIATATYGSELSPQVSFLRDFRDNKVLSTFAGSNFMTIFNKFYYSFSPSIASVIADNSVLRGIMNVVLYPLIGILQVSSTVFSLLSINSEIAIVLSGLVASSLIGLVYLTPLLTLILQIKRTQKHILKSIRPLSTILVSSLILIFSAEIVSSNSLMMFATGTTILAILGLSTLSASKHILKRLKSRAS
jgi:hypothetical protein